MFSYVDLVRTELALEAGQRFEVIIPDEETDRWRSLGDAARSIALFTRGATTEQDVFGWLCVLIAEGYGVSAVLTQDEEVFGDYDRMTSWFMSPPYPQRLGDRWFVRGERTETPPHP